MPRIKRTINIGVLRDDISELTVRVTIERANNQMNENRPGKRRRVRRRVKREMIVRFWSEKETKDRRNAALSKLTPLERKLLGW